MISSVQQALLDRLAEACELSEDIRLGQLLDLLGFLGQDSTGSSLAEIEDDQLLAVVERHCHDLRRRVAAAEPRA